jgi:hypothetical protein
MDDFGLIIQIRPCILFPKIHLILSRTFEILGCSYEEFKSYIENKFESWMNWNNHGLYTGNYSETWQLDHIIPISSAKTEEDIIKLNHYTNLQPLCSKINQIDKKDKLDW